MDPNTVRVIAFDLDGTLTQHRTPLPAESRAILDRLGARWKLLMVGAGQCRRIYRQMEGYPIDIIGNYGMQYCEYDRETGAPRMVWDEHAPCDRESVEERVALVFCAIWRLFPTPVATTMPPFETAERMRLTARAKDAPIESEVFLRPSISIAKTSVARLIISSSVILFSHPSPSTRDPRPETRIRALVRRHGLPLVNIVSIQHETQ